MTWKIRRYHSGHHHQHHQCLLISRRHQSEWYQRIYHQLNDNPKIRCISLQVQIVWKPSTLAGKNVIKVQYHQVDRLDSGVYAPKNFNCREHHFHQKFNTFNTSGSYQHRKLSQYRHTAVHAHFITFNGNALQCIPDDERCERTCGLYEFSSCDLANGKMHFNYAGSGRSQPSLRDSSVLET